MTGEPTARQRREGPILVVDDDPDFRDAMAMFLESEGYEVASASEGYGFTWPRTSVSVR